MSEDSPESEKSDIFFMKGLFRFFFLKATQQEDP